MPVRWTLTTAVALAALSGRGFAQAGEGTSESAVAAPGSPNASSPRENPRRAKTRRVSLRRRTAPLTYSTPTGTYSLASSLDTLLGARVRKGTWGVLVVSLTRGDTLYAANADASLEPASTMKLFTTALAFDRLGPQHQLNTDVLRDGNLSPDGTLNGNLVLRGGGDPALSNRFIPGDPGAPMRALARQVSAAGIRRIRGNLVGDATAFEPKLVPDGWSRHNIETSYGQRVSALSLNENLLHVAIAPGAGKAAARISLVPGILGYTVLNQTRTVPGSRKARLTVSRRPDGTIVAKGWIGSSSEVRVYVVVVDEPARFAAGAFRQALHEEGIDVTGDVQLGAAPASSTVVATLASPPLAQIASVMNRESVNHFAELLFRDAARTAGPNAVGSAAGGNALLQQMLGRAGVRPDAVFAADGSGLSTLDRVTPRALVQLLSFADKAPWSREFHASLPVAGESELLRHRMRATPAEGNLHAKTGTTNSVIALGGYVTARDGEQLAFSFVYNGRERWSARETIDAMGGTLAAFSR
ncbi:MAG: D-alanyl-D-alanine carboxypeptidase/D-alanyl-D-alanine-endopeptidase [Gemmatimonadaceae bacterium]